MKAISQCSGYRLVNIIRARNDFLIVNPKLVRLQRFILGFWGSGIRQNSENKGHSGEFHYVQPNGLVLKTH
jgi:hypothetical protein